MLHSYVPLMTCILLHFLISTSNGEENYDPCCSFPCQNFGICNRIGFTDKYYCDCHGTGYYGNDCEIVTWGKWIYEKIRPSPYTVQRLTTNGRLIWKIINRIKSIHSFIIKIILKIRATFPPWPEPHNTAADYVTFHGYHNKSYYALTLPPVPKNCPTPMGIAGPKQLPDVDELVDKVFRRTEFKPCPRGTAFITPTYGQHFTHQGFKTVMSDRRITWGTQTVDLSHIYGKTESDERALRTLQGGKMKMKIINGEEYPPHEDDCPGLKMNYPPMVKKEHRFGLGHPFFAMLPFLLYWSTFWLREHNRVAEIMAKEHPHWDDERVFQTTKLIILGETMKVTVETYVQHVSGMHLQLTYQPELLHGTSHRWSSNRVHVEFNSIYHWHSMIPGYYYVGDKNYTLNETYFNMKPLLDHGMKEFTESLSNQVAGRGAGGRNIAPRLLTVAKETIKWNRDLRLQPFNRYRQYVRLPPYKTFEDLTGEKKLAKILSDLYGGDIDALEMLVGMLVEKRYKAKMWGLTLIETIASYSLRSVYANAIGSPEFWKESTFGGKVGFDIVKSARMEDIACRVIKGCPKLQFQVPEAITEDTDPGMVYNDLDDVTVSTIRKDEL